MSKHNLRGYKSDNYDKSLIDVMRGSDNILKDVQQVYESEFSEAMLKYNQKQKRDDRKISNYLEHVSKSRSDVAAELIIQVGDMEFWSNKDMDDKKVMKYIFEDQIRSLEQLCPNFKIASAVAHYDEKSPHLHVVGVPVADGYEKGMEKQVAKTKVFTKDSLSMLQDQMHKRAERGIEMNQAVFGDKQLKEKEKGRNKDIPKYALGQFYEVQEKVKEKEMELVEVEKDVIEARNEAIELKNNTEGIEVLLKEKKAEYEAITERIEHAKENFLSNNAKIMNQELTMAINDNTINNQKAQISSQEAQIEDLKRISDKFADESSEIDYEFAYEYKGKVESSKPIPMLKRIANGLKEKIDNLKEKIDGLMEHIKSLTSRKESLELECERMEHNLEEVGVLVSESARFEAKDRMMEQYDKISAWLKPEEEAAFKEMNVEKMQEINRGLLYDMHDSRGMHHKYSELIECVQEYLRLEQKPVSIQELKEQIEEKQNLERDDLEISL